MRDSPLNPIAAIILVAAVLAGCNKDTHADASGKLPFFDDFEYEVDRNSAGASDIFSANGWSYAKTYQDGRKGARGYLYTTDSIPGYSGPFPGKSSKRVLALEAKPAAFQGQTDFFLQFGGGEFPIGTIPANHWYQFWIYPQHFGDQDSLFTGGKFLYANRATAYPATLSNGGFVYMISFDKETKSLLNSVCTGGRNIGCTEGYFHSGWNTSAGMDNHIPGLTEKYGSNLTTEPPFSSNKWTLIKIHVDISGTDPRAAPGQAVYEQWFRRLGDTEWTKAAEWIGGATRVDGQPINFTPAFTDGLRTLRMPTTIGAPNESVGDWFDFWLYMDDFVIAGSEDQLPVYP